MGYGMKYTKGGFPFKTDKKDNFLKEQREEAVESTDYLEKLPNPTTKAVPSKPKPMTEKETSSDHELGNLEDKMRDEGVFSIGGQKNN